MKHILVLMVALLICVGPVRAGELKVMVPVDDFKQMQAKLKVLEEENSQLKQAVNSASGGGWQDNEALKNRLAVIENENNQLKQQLRAEQQSQGNNGSDLANRMAALEQENSRLQQQLAAGQVQAPVMTDAELESKLAEAQNENLQLQQQVSTLKGGGVMALISGDQRTARQVYAEERNAVNRYSYKF